MKNIVLIGMMGCGKTTCARLLARRLGWEAADTDALIVGRQNRPIAHIFETDGEAYFRALERETALALGRRSGLVIACGGGLPTVEGAMEALKQTGTVVFLNRDPEAIFDAESMEGRPLAQGGRADFLARFARRAPIYRRWADLEITEFSSPEATADAILEGLQ